MNELNLINNNIILPCSIKNEQLHHATYRIVELGEGIREKAYETAYIMAQVDREKCYVEDGYKNVHDWAMKMFGFKKTTSYALLKIGKEYTEQLTYADCSVSGYKSNLTETYSGDFSVCQLNRMLPLGHDVAEELVKADTITPYMTVKEIAQVVKDYQEQQKLSACAENETSENTESAESAETTETTIKVTDDNGNVYMIPAEVLAQYRA